MRETFGWLGRAMSLDRQAVVTLSQWAAVRRLGRSRGRRRERGGGEEAAAFGGIDPPLTAVLRIKSDDDAAVGARLQ